MKQHDPDAVARAERDTWNRCADKYKCAAPFTAHAVNFLIEAARLSPESRALDVACGPGHITRMMADTGATGCCGYNPDQAYSGARSYYHSCHNSHYDFWRKEAGHYARAFGDDVRKLSFL